MKLIAIRKILEIRENAIEVTETVFEVSESETLGQILARMKVSGRFSWEFSEMEVKIKLVRERIEP